MSDPSVPPKPQLHWDGPQSANPTIVLAHGAGAGSDSDFMQAMAALLSERGLRVGRFDFPYMQRQKATGRKRPPDPEPVLREAWKQVLASVPQRPLLIGGKSLGGRIASLVAAAADVTGVACLGYPFHPPGKPERLRTEHLQSMRMPTLIVQGERDPFGTFEQVQQYTLSPAVRVIWLPDGDHSFRPRKASGVSLQENLTAAADAVARFAASL